MTDSADPRLDAGRPAKKPCPICGRPSSDQDRPFCSRRCSDVDLNRWLSGHYALPAEPGSTLDDDEPGDQNP